MSAGEARACFPDADEFLTVPVELLDGHVSDPSLRRLLSEVGLPNRFTEVVEFHEDLGERLWSVADSYAKYDNQPPEGSSGLYVLGFAGSPYLTVDGDNGAVFQVHDDFGVRPIATSLEAFLRVLCVLVEEAGSDDDEEMTERVLAERDRIDPDAPPAAAHAWAELIDDVRSSEEW